MGHQSTRLNLTAAAFPFASELFGQTIMVPRTDMAALAAPSNEDTTPEAFYMHNCMPTSQGYQAVSYDTAVVPFATPVTDFDQAFGIQNSDLNRFLFSPAGGKNYIFDRQVSAWASISPIPAGTFGLTGTPMVTTAYVHNQTYICYANYGVFVYNDVTKVLTPVAFAGITMTNVKGICAANGYMIIWDSTSIAWSNSAVPTDFVPSIITGASVGSVNDAKGAIICCLPISGGLLVYCEKNIVGATYTGNAQFPYSFLEVPGSSGITTPEDVTWQANLAYHIVWSSSGLLQVALTGAAEKIFPEFTSFIAGKVFEDFNETTLALTSQYLSTQLTVKLTIIENGMLALSIGIAAPNFTHVFVFDATIKRWGRLKIDHKDCFPWNTPNFYGQTTYTQLGNITYAGLGATTYNDFANPTPTPEQPKETFAFLQADGTVKTVNFQFSEVASNGVLYLGKYQYTRSKRMKHQYTDIQNVRNGQSFAFYVVPTNDGDTLLTPVATRNIPAFTGAYTKRQAREVSGYNFSLLFIGAFNIVSAVMDFTLNGDN